MTDDAGTASGARGTGFAAVLAVVLIAAVLLPLLAARHARPLLLNLGPNDQEYVRGFREDWERDGLTRFHWTTLSSSVRWPLSLAGDGHRLRMRLRRHFVDPAVVTLTISGQPFAKFEIACSNQA